MLNLFLAGVIVKLTAGMKETLKDLDSDEMELKKDIHEFAKICVQDPRSTRAIMASLDGKMTTGIGLTFMLISDKDLMAMLPKKALRYVAALPHFFLTLQLQFLEETGFTPVKSHTIFTGNGSFMFDSATGTSVQFASSPVTGPVMPSGAPCPMTEAGPEATEEGVDASPGEELCQQQEELPEFLKVLPLKPEEKQKILLLLKFIRTRNLEYKERIFVLIVGGADKILKEYMNLGRADILIDKMAGRMESDGRQPQGFRCVYYNPKSKQAKRYKFKVDPGLKEQVMALL